MAKDCVLLLSGRRPQPWLAEDIRWPNLTAKRTLGGIFFEPALRGEANEDWGLALALFVVPLAQEEGTPYVCLIGDGGPDLPGALIKEAHAALKREGLRPVTYGDFNEV